MSIGEKFEKIADAVYEKGKADGKKDFFDKLPYDSKAVKFYGWKDELFYPTKDILIGEQTFYYSEIIDIANRLDEQGVKIKPTSTCPYTFGYCLSVSVPEVDMSSITSSNYMFANFGAASSQANKNNLQTIRKIIASEKTVFGTGCFSNLYKLTHCLFEGTIAKSLDIHWSTKLNRASILSLLQCLNASVTGVTITLPSKCIDTATDTKAMIEGDTELNTAYTQALANGYTIAFQ